MMKFITYMITLIGLMFFYGKYIGNGNITTVPFFIMAILAFAPFILPSWIKSKLDERKERKKEEERLKYQQYLDSLPKEPEIEIPKSVYFAEDDEEFVKEFGKPTINKYFSDDPKIIKNVRYVGENYGPRNDFDLIAYNNLSYDVRYDVKNKIYKIIDMDKNYEMYKIDYAIINGYIYETEYNKNTDTLKLYYLRKK